MLAKRTRAGATGSPAVASGFAWPLFIRRAMRQGVDMGGTSFWPKGKPQRRRRLLTIVAIPLLLLAGALLDPAIIAPFGPLASRPERVAATFTPCGPGRGTACVIDGDTFKLGERKVRITGIDAPEVATPRCPAEAALGRKAGDRLLALLNQGDFDLVGHRFNGRDRHGRDLRTLWRGNTSIGDQLITEGLAHRYMGMKRSWC